MLLAAGRIMLTCDNSARKSAVKGLFTLFAEKLPFYCASTLELIATVVICFLVSIFLATFLGISDLQTAVITLSFRNVLEFDT